MLSVWRGKWFGVLEFIAVSKSKRASRDKSRRRILEPGEGSRRDPHQQTSPRLYRTV